MRPTARNLRLVLALSTLALGAAVAPSAALASSLIEAPLAFSPPALIDHQRPLTTPASIHSLSCPSSELCVAVDNLGDVVTTTKPTEAEPKWTPVDADSNFPLSAVSCTSTGGSSTLCVAVDNEGDVVSSSDPTAEHPTWTVKPVDVSSGQRHRLTSVSCTSASLCVAGDDFGDVIVSTDPGAGNEATWTVEHVDGSHTLNAVSCVGGELCVAVDNEGNVLTAARPTSEPENWTLTHVDANGIASVSCASSTLCVAGDNVGSVLTTTNPAGGEWAVTEDVGESVITEVAAILSTNPQPISSISCPTTSFCVAVSGGEVVDSSEPTKGPAAIWTAKQIDPAKGPSPTAPGAGGVALTGVSCPSGTRCLAVNANGAVLTTTDATAGEGAEAGSEWKLIKPFDQQGQGPASVSCPSSSLCVGGEATGRVFTSTKPSGSEWKVKAIPVDGGHAIASVSCPSNELCLAVDDAGNALSTTEPAKGEEAVWTKPKSIDAGHTIASVSCPSSELCVAVDNAGNALSTTEPAKGEEAVWKLKSIDSVLAVTSVSCPSSELCVALDKQGHALSTTEPTKGEAAVWKLRTLLFGEEFGSVSCPSSTLCVAALGKEPLNIMSTTKPAEREVPTEMETAPTWTRTSLGFPGNVFANGVSCSSRKLCVVVGGDAAASHGSVATSSNEGATWKEAEISPGHTLSDVSCVGTELCVAVDGQTEHLWVTTDPTATTPEWKEQTFGAGLSLKVISVSCVKSRETPPICVALGRRAAEDFTLSSTDPSAATPTWKPAPAPEEVDLEVEQFPAEGESIDTVVCPSASACYFSGRLVGDPYLVTNPTGATPAWTRVPANAQHLNRGTLTGGITAPISCASTLLCILATKPNEAETASGTLVTELAIATHSPEGESNRWQSASDRTAAGGGPPLLGRGPAAVIESVSCTSTEGKEGEEGAAGEALCVGVDGHGNVVSSTDPADAAQATWKTRAQDAGEIIGKRHLSCVRSELCVEVQNQHAVSSTEAAKVAPSPTGWTASNMFDGANPITSLACEASSPLCVAVDSHGNVLSSTHPTEPDKWTSKNWDSTSYINGVSCDPTSSLCVAVDRQGNVLTATEPKAEQPTWKLEQEVDGEGPLHPINVVACPSMKLCLAGDGEGKVLSSQNPGAGAGEEATWTPKRVDSGQSITGVSCPSSELCVAVDDAGNVLSTTEPAKGAEAVWTEPKSIDAGHAITGVSCPSSELCVAVDHSGNVLSTSEPTKGEEAKWTGPAEVDKSKTSGVASLAGVSCASSALCVANDTSGSVVSSTEPTNPESWKVTEGVEYGNPITALSCPSSALCVAGDRLGHIALGTPQLSVTVSGSGHGTVEGPGNLSCTARCTKRYEGGQAVTLTATPANGSTFAGWGGACSGTASTCTVTMGAGLEVTAEFTASPQAELTPGLTSPAFGCCNFTGPAREVKPLAGTLLGNPSASAKGVSLTLSCQGSAGQSCDYTALLTTTEHLKGNKVSAISAAKRKQASTKILTVGKATFAVAAGQQKTILIKLSRAASQLLARFHKLPLTLTVTLTNGAGGKSSTVAKRTLLVKTKSKAKPKSKHR